jgi:alkylated DNA repair protein (DNA oxidative demethylase)
MTRNERREAMHDLFDNSTEGESRRATPAFAPILLRGFALNSGDRILAELERIMAAAPLRHMVTPGGFTMSVAMTNCGSVGWITDRSGYRYDAIDPMSGKRWPRMPAIFRELATTAAAQAGFEGFVPDACLVNRYEPGTKLSLHQDKDEKDFEAPVVSVSLGLPARFLFGGLKRSDPCIKIPLDHGDIVVWGGPARLAFHGVMPLEDGLHATLGRQRINLTFRRAR